MNKIIFTKKAPTPIGPYSQAVIANGMLYCSGQIALDPSSGEFIAGSITEQTERVIQNIKAVLNSCDLDFDSVIKTTCFLTCMDNFTEFNKVYEKYFIEKPARSCVGVKELPKNALIEIEVIALCSR